MYKTDSDSVFKGSEESPKALKDEYDLSTHHEKWLKAPPGFLSGFRQCSIMFTAL